MFEEMTNHGGPRVGIEIGEAGPAEYAWSKNNSPGGGLGVATFVDNSRYGFSGDSRKLCWGEKRLTQGIGSCGFVNRII